jgi:hypothetical protein
MVVDVCNPGTQEAEAGGHNLEASLGYIERDPASNKTKTYRIIKFLKNMEIAFFFFFFLSCGIIY